MTHNEFNTDNSLFIPSTDLNSKKLIIFFSGTDRESKHFDFFRIASEMKHNALLLNNGKNEWYQYGIPSLGSSLEKTICRIRNFIEKNFFEEVFCVGMSMGGYGACLYASLLNAKVLAFGFDSKLMLPGSRSKKRFRTCSVPELNDLLPIIQNSGIDVTQIAGECDALDLYSCCLLSDLPNVKTLSISGVGHGVPPFIKKNYNLADFINNWIEGNEQFEILEKTNNYMDKLLVKYLYQMQLLFRAKNWLEVIEMKVNGYEKFYFHEYVNYMLGVAYLELGNNELSLEHLSKSVSSAPHFAGARYRLARVLMKKKLYSYSKIHFFSHIINSDKPAYSHLFLSDIFLRENNIKCAWKHLEIAIQLGVPEEKTLIRKSKLSNANLY